MTDEQLKELCYFVNSWIRLMGFGGEYNRLIRTIAKTYPDFDFSAYYYINEVLKKRGKK